MNYKKRFFLFFFLVLNIGWISNSNAITAQSSNTSAVASKESFSSGSSSFMSGLNNIIRSAPANVHIGVMVQSMQTGRTLYTYHPDYLFMPASVQKLFVAVSALAILKPDYHFSTRLLSNARVENGVLGGDLVVQFSGDPSLNTTDLINLLSQLKAQGVQSIRGHVYVDNTAYDNVPYPPGWFWDDLSYSFAAPINAVILNENRFSLTIAPGSVGVPAVITPLMPPGVINIQNATLTQAQRNCPLSIYSDFGNHYKVVGCINNHSGKQYHGLALRDPVVYAQALVQNYLRDNQISFQFPVLVGTVQTNNVLAQHDSLPLYLLVKKMLKHSDNLYTNALLKKTGEVYYHSQGSFRTGIYAMRALLAQGAGINFKRVFIADGAGLSRYNLLTPRELVQLLYYAYHQNQVIPYLLNGLPIAGVDGTLRWRMPAMGKGQRVHAKTGTMKSVVGLAGYVNTDNNGVLGFAIIVNGFVDRYTPYRAFADRVCEYLATAPRG